MWLWICNGFRYERSQCSPGYYLRIIGCVFCEMLSGEPIFEGNTDIEQIYLIIKCLGKVTPCNSCNAKVVYTLLLSKLVIIHHSKSS